MFRYNHITLRKKHKSEFGVPDAKYLISFLRELHSNGKLAISLKELSDMKPKQIVEYLFSYHREYMLVDCDTMLVSSDSEIIDQYEPIVFNIKPLLDSLSYTDGLIVRMAIPFMRHLGFQTNVDLGLDFLKDIWVENIYEGDDDSDRHRRINAYNKIISMKLPSYPTSYKNFLRYSKKAQSEKVKAIVEAIKFFMNEPYDLMDAFNSNGTESNTYFNLMLMYTDEDTELLFKEFFLFPYNEFYMNLFAGKTMSSDTSKLKNENDYRTFNNHLFALQ